MDIENEEESDDSEITGDLELDEEERRMLDMAELEDEDELNDIENLEAKMDNKDKILSKKRKNPVNIKFEDEPELELEYEREDLVKP